LRLIIRRRWMRFYALTERTNLRFTWHRWGRS